MRFWKEAPTYCPRCEDECKVEKFHDEIGLVETDVKCKCGYHYNWSYGHITTDEEYDEQNQSEQSE
jgi:Zn ribbon nucleic-acid-binding protein